MRYYKGTIFATVLIVSSFIAVPVDAGVTVSVGDEPSVRTEISWTMQPEMTESDSKYSYLPGSHDASEHKDSLGMDGEARHIASVSDKTVTVFTEQEGNVNGITIGEGGIEFSFLPGAHGTEDYAMSKVIGTGEKAEIEVSENGNYTLFAKDGDRIESQVVPVTTVDRNAPEVTISDAVLRDDGTVTVFYNAEDYFSQADTVILDGKNQNCFEDGKAVGAGSIEGLTDGEYTLLSRDSAGNIATYDLTVGSGNSSKKSNTEENSAYSRKDQWGYGANFLTYTAMTPGQKGPGERTIIVRNVLEKEPIAVTEPLTSELNVLPQTGGFDENMKLYILSGILIVTGILGICYTFARSGRIPTYKGNNRDNFFLSTTPPYRGQGS